MSQIEKRKSPRVVVDLVSVEINDGRPGSDSSTEQEIYPVMNISESGMMFEAGRVMLPGETLRLTFALPDSPVMIRTEAIVIHCAKKRMFRIGAQFCGLGIAEQKLLRHFINKVMAAGQ